MISFFCALFHSKVDELISSLKVYLGDEPRFVIGMEVATDTHAETKGEHLHICAEMDDKDYDRFRKTILVNKYGLRGQAKNGLPRQYGKIRNIRDETKMLQYTVKDQNVISEGFTIDEIKYYIKNSYKKKESRNIFREILEYLTNSDLWDEYHRFQIPLAEKQVIRFYMDNLPDKVPTRNIVKNHVARYLINIKDVELFYSYML